MVLDTCTLNRVRVSVFTCKPVWVFSYLRMCLLPCDYVVLVLMERGIWRTDTQAEQHAILEQPLSNDRDIEACNCYYCQTQIETHNLPDSSYQLSLSKKTGLSAVCPRRRELSVDTQSNWGASQAVWTHSKRGEMNTWSEHFYVFGDDLISHNVYFIAHYAINLHGSESKCDIFI